MSQSQGKTKTTNQSFLAASSTYWVTLVRLALVVLPHFASSTLFADWLYNPYLLSVLIRPHQCLAQLEEAHAIQALAPDASSRKTFFGFYLANDSVRIPPLAIAFLSPFLKTPNPELWLSLFLLVVDFSIAYFLEQVGVRVLGLLSSPEPPLKGNSSGDDNNDKRSNDLWQPQRTIEEEEELQRKLPECIRPPFSQIFPIYRHEESLSSGVLPKEGASSESRPESNPLISMASLPLLSAQLYYWSPFTILPACLYNCWQNVPTLFLVASVYESASYSSGGSLSMVSFYLAAATYLEPHHVVYAVPIILLSFTDGFTQQSKNRPSTAKPISFFFLVFGVWSLLLQGVSCSLVGPSNYWKVARVIYGNTWLTTSPNLSLQWYFRMQLFARFRNYFGAMFGMIPYILVGPLCMRFHRYPAVQLAIWTLIWTMYRPVQVLFDANFAFCFFLFCPQSMARMGYASLISLCCLPVPLILNIVDQWMWLGPNNGNANYIFFQCVAHNVFLATIVGQFISASLQRDKALRLTHQKEVNGETTKVKQTKID